MLQRLHAHGHHQITQGDRPLRFAVQVVEDIPQIQGLGEEFAAAGVFCARFVAGVEGAAKVSLRLFDTRSVGVPKEYRIAPAKSEEASFETLCVDARSRQVCRILNKCPEKHPLAHRAGVSDTCKRRFLKESDVVRVYFV